jgi:5'-methylthioinosine phosphorylase
MSVYGMIGGTGLERLEGLEVVQQHNLQTPYGDPSGPVEEGRLLGHTVYFLHRHGGARSVPPHLINYRANIWALHSLGVESLIGINAVGGISAGMRPGRLLIPDQLVDYSWGREHTFDTGDDGTLLHIDFTEPYDRSLRMSLLGAAQSARIPHEDSGVYGVTQGPRLETEAEIIRMERDGCDVVGMTGMPEAALARELGLAYASICMVVNPAAGLGDVPLTLEMMRDILTQEAGVVRKLINALLQG